MPVVLFSFYFIFLDIFLSKFRNSSIVSSNVVLYVDNYLASLFIFLANVFLTTENSVRPISDYMMSPA